MAGDRFNTGKLKWSLVSWMALAPMVRVLMFGAEKYDDHNWKKGLKYTEVCESLQRHINAFIEGEENDPESKLSHVGHILCNAMFLSYMSMFKKDMDDRYIDTNIEPKPVAYRDTEEYKNNLLSEKDISISPTYLKKDLDE
jgi:hypothetical protein